MIELKCIGRLTKEPEARLTKEEKKVVNISVASNNRDETTYIDFTLFGSTAEAVEKYSHKGDLILVEAIIKNNNYTDKEGKKHYEYAFIGNKIEFLSRASKETKKEENKNNIAGDELFDEFGKKIEIEESELAF
jgi:single-strand DNA-binding protein